MGRLELRGFRNRRAMVPRTNVLADIATEDVRSHRRPLGFRDRPAKFDGEIRNAEARVDRISALGGRRNDRTGWAGIYTTRAGTAAIRRRGIFRIGFDFERDQQFSQEEPRAALLIDEAGILADPAEAGLARIRPLQ